MRFVVFCLVLTAIATKTFALEALGPMYPVIELDLLELLTTHAREERENVTKRYENAQKRFESMLDRPAGNPLPVTTVERTWRLLPEIADRTPLAGFERQWLMIDADDEKQVDLARRFMKEKTVATHRVILTSGSVSATQKKLNRRVWFDQNARLVTKLAIRAVPCVVKMNEEGVLLKEIRP